MDAKPDQIRDYRDLIVWKEAMDIAELVYRLTRAFPREEAFGLAAQMRRCAVSIPSNIAEGFGRAQRKVFIQFLRIAQGSLKELETQLMLAVRVELVPWKDVSDIQARCQTLGKRFVRYIRSLEQPAP
jgi:four helix bundle protein